MLNFSNQSTPNQRPKPDYVIEKNRQFNNIYDKSKPYTMTSKARMYALYQAVKYIIKANIPGDFVECGVWKGGSTMLIALTLKALKQTSRQIYLYDTFQGMSRPTVKDYQLNQPSKKASTIWQQNRKDKYNQWCFTSLSRVKKNMFSTGYPQNQLVFVKGKVEDSIPRTIPQQISLLRLDTDWYKSTKHELIHLFPLLSQHGVLIIDDYGYWAGSKKAVDQYFTKKPILFNRIDRSAIIAVKT